VLSFPLLDRILVVLLRRALQMQLRRIISVEAVTIVMVLVSVIVLLFAHRNLEIIHLICACVVVTWNVLKGVIEHPQVGGLASHFAWAHNWTLASSFTLVEHGLVIVDLVVPVVGVLVSMLGDQSVVQVVLQVHITDFMHISVQELLLFEILLN
jgi:hypothetical protein